MRNEPGRGVGMMDVYRLTEIGQSAVESLIDGVVVVIEKPEIVAKIAGEENEPDADESRRYDPTPHGASIGTKLTYCQYAGREISEINASLENVPSVD